jgi:UDP:flavonoid glycosyltransferase YjiC (YdhE family)
MSTILMVPHAPGGTLAHLAACLAVAGAMRDREHQPVFAYGGSRPELIEGAGFEWHPVVEAAGPMHWEWFETPEELDRMVSSHLDLIDRLSPAACVTSAGFARLAGEIRGVPVMALSHGLPGSSYGRRALRPWMLRDAARHPTRLLGHLRSRMGHTQGANANAAIAEVRRRRSLPPRDPSTALIGGSDLVALTTAPFLDPARGLPEHWRYVGPLDYGTDGASAAEREATDGARVYVSQGSTGSAEHLRQSVRELSAAGYGVVASTGGLCDPRELAQLGPAVRAEEILDTRSELETADLAVIAGGHMTAMQALLAGTPTVVIPATSQQATGALRAQRLGTGLALWPRVPRGSIGRAARRILRDRRYTARSEQLAARLRAEWNGNARAAALAEALISR